jgi:formate-dependent nitrite reductase cytochrome c552 subunit
MASWGRNADVTLTGTGSIDANTNIVTGANTVFTEEVEIRNVIDLDGDRFVVITITDDETMTVEPIATATVEDSDVLLSEVPKYLTVAQATTEATYVTVAEAQDSDNRDIGIKTPGWTLYKEYETQNGDTRRVVETLVAMKSTS